MKSDAGRQETCPLRGSAAGCDKGFPEHRFVPLGIFLPTHNQGVAGAAIESKEDPLFGLKENVIIGKLIPAGTGFEHGRFDEVPEEEPEAEEAAADGTEELVVAGEAELVVEAALAEGGDTPEATETAEVKGED